MNYNPIIQKLVNKEFMEVEKLCIQELKKNKLDAQLWLYLAQALAFQGFGATAMAVFNRAWILDPEALWIEQAREDLIGTDITKSKVEIDKLLKVSNVSVTAALIVKNESVHIKNCLCKIHDSVDEIIIVDTGSTDNTIEIAKKFSKVKVVNFEWCDDFAAARNAALSYITSEWVIWIDADEYLYEEDFEAVKEVAGIFKDIKVPVVIRIGIMCQNDDGSIFGQYTVSRMFRLRDNFKFFGRIHEQIVHDGKGIYHQENTYSRAARIRLLHHGYKLSVIQEKKKIDRNIKLLQKMVDENPEDPAWLFFYGRELFNGEKYNESMAVLLKCERTAYEYPGFGRLLELYTMIAYIFIHRNDYDSAEEVCKKALNQRDDFPDILYLLAMINLEKGYRLYKSAEEYVKKSKASYESYRDIVSPDYSIFEWKAELLLADIALHQGRVCEAYGLYQKVLEVSPLKDEILNKIEYINQEKEKLS